MNAVVGDAGKTVWWAALPERTGAGSGSAFNNFLSVAIRSGIRDYRHLSIDPTRTDDARNKISRLFMEYSRNPKDTLVMLDADHDHPCDIIERLVVHNVGVVGALCFRRSHPYDPCVFVKVEDGFTNMDISSLPASAGLVQCTMVGTGAIAIQRWVFTKLQESKLVWPWFRLVYNPAFDTQPGEDIYFGLSCYRSGIPHFCDFGLESPHCGEQKITRATYEKAKADMAKEKPVSISAGGMIFEERLRSF